MPYKNKENEKRWYEANKEKNRTRAKDWKRANPARAKLNAQNYRLSKYGITLEEYRILATNQNGKCAICKQIKKLCVDHNHKTGELRALLCRQCNLVLGLVDDNRQTLEAALEYLTKYS